MEHTRLLKKTLLIIFIMFLFSFAMAPLYSVFCKQTGLDGKGLLQKDATYSLDIDTSRVVTIEFDANNNNLLPFKFHSSIRKISAHPGEIISLYYMMKNLQNKKVIVQAIPSVAPPIASNYIKKLECFCFTNQNFEENQSIMMPLRIVIDPKLPAHIKYLTLSYTLFDVSKNIPGSSS